MALLVQVFLFRPVFVRKTCVEIRVQDFCGMNRCGSLYMSKEVSVRLISAFCLVCSLVAPASLVQAQAVANATVSGQVADQTGAAVVGAAVKMIETERGVTHEAASDSDGRYTLDNVRLQELCSERDCAPGG
jgi:hypothetical protein